MVGTSNARIFCGQGDGLSALIGASSLDPEDAMAALSSHIAQLVEEFAIQRRRDAQDRFMAVVSAGVRVLSLGAALISVGLIASALHGNRGLVIIGLLLSRCALPMQPCGTRERP